MACALRKQAFWASGKLHPYPIVGLVKTKAGPPFHGHRSVAQPLRDKKLWLVPDGLAGKNKFTN